VDTGKDIERFSDDCPSEKETLRVVPLPCLQELSAEQRTKFIVDMISFIEQNDRHERSVGVAGILRQDPLAFPKETKRSVRPLCHATTLLALAGLR